MATKTLTWDTRQGQTPKVNDILNNGQGDRYLVIARKGNKITIKSVIFDPNHPEEYGTVED